MIKVGVTGQKGFIGYHLSQTLRLNKEEFELIPFEKEYFESDSLLDAFVSKCDIIVHLAGLNRHNNSGEISHVNTTLAKRLIAALERTVKKPHVLMSSSTQEERENEYGRSKKEARELLSSWASKRGGRFSGMIIPNVYGPFGRPFYNSVVATFCHQIAAGETPKVEVDSQLKLIYVGELVNLILRAIREKDDSHQMIVSHSGEATVSQLAATLATFKEVYQDKGDIPRLTTNFDLNLFNTYRGYIDLRNYFPRKFIEHKDVRGAFVEVIRLGVGGQVSFSTTLPGVVRGNHFHTRKIERFAVIKGTASIGLRRIGTTDVVEFGLSGEQPAYVDMPIWYTHNIKNVGSEELWTIFWISERYDPENADTYFEDV